MGLAGSFKIDISLNHEDGVKAVPVIADYMQRMPALRYLVMVMKGFLAQHNLNSAAYGGLSSYSLICLAISFLQVGVCAPFYILAYSALVHSIAAQPLRSE